MSAAQIVLDRVRVAAAETAGLHLTRVGEDVTFKSLGLDSLDQVELVMELEEHFAVRISDDEGDALTGIVDAAQLVVRKLGEKAGG